MAARKPKALPPLPWPKLSEQGAYAKSPDTCQCCGQTWDVDVYIECDEADRQTTTAIAVCIDCARLHVEPHPRFYHEMEHNRPFPGAMNVCIECPHRVGLSCSHPLLKANGGPGLNIRASKPEPAFFDGSEGMTCVMMTYSAVPWCDGRPIIRDQQPPRGAHLRALPTSGSPTPETTTP